MTHDTLRGSLPAPIGALDDKGVWRPFKSPPRRPRRPDEILHTAQGVVASVRKCSPEIQAKVLANARRLAVTEKDDDHRRIIVEFIRLVEQEP